MDNYRIDHIAHGRAVLAMRVPQVRKVDRENVPFADIFESYSLAVLFRQKLSTDPTASLELIQEYDRIVCEIEQEAAYYLDQKMRPNSKFDWAD